MMLPVAISQFRPRKADPDATLEHLGGVLREVAGQDPAPRVLVFPESALTGYFLEGGVREHALDADEVFDALRAAWRDTGSGDRPLDVAIGFYERHRDRVFNSALYATVGGPEAGVVDLHRKVFLPTYGVFQEDRFVEAGAGFHAFDTGWGRAAMLVCEDAWHSLSGTLAALDGAQVLFVLSASPAHGAEPGPGVPGNVERWDRLARGIAEEHGVFVVVSQLTGFEGGKGFPGGSVIVDPRGRPQARGALWEEDLVSAALDLDSILQARSESPLLADLEAALPRILRNAPAISTGPASDGRSDDGGGGSGSAAGDDPGREAPGASATARNDAGARADDVRAEGGGAHVPPLGRPYPAVRASRPDPDDASPLRIDEALVEEWLTRFLQEEVRERRGFGHVVLGLSGGVDSSVTALLAAAALGPDDVTGFLLPSDVSSEESREHALQVAEIAGIETRTVEITPAVEGYVERHEPDASELRRGNVMARVRMIVLFDQAKKFDALPIGTGNKSERLLGYFTWHADDSPPINPLGDLFKTQVWDLARHLGVPDEIVDKPASAELVEEQTDEVELGLTYPEADLILHHVLHGRSPEELVRYGFPEENVRIVWERLQSTHFKRNLPTVAMISSTAIGEWYLRPVDY